MKKKIVGVGNALTDMLFLMKDDGVLKNLNIRKGGMLLVEKEVSVDIENSLSEIKPIMETGGSASNTISTMAKLGVESAFIGKVGNDKIGEFFVSDCSQNGVTPHIVRSTTSSGHCDVLVSPDSERTMCTFLGAASELTIDDICRDVIKKYDFLHVEGYLIFNKELIIEVLKIAKEEGLETSIDLASFNIVEDNRDLMLELIEKYVDIVFANNEEAKALTGKGYPNSVEDIAKMCKIAIVKNGKHGSIVCSEDKKYPIAPFDANPVDTTGAGDSYAAGFLYGYLTSKDLDACGTIGSLVSAKSVESVGPKIPAQKWDKLLERIKKIV